MKTPIILQERRKKLSTVLEWSRTVICDGKPGRAPSDACFVALTPSLSFSLQFEGEEQFNGSVKTLLSRLPKQRYLKSICDEIHTFKLRKK